MKNPRGYALVIVLVLAAAAVTVATGLSRQAGATQQSAIRTVGQDLSRAIAQSGLERAEAWLLEIARARGDFDTALDPRWATGDGADCTGLLGFGAIAPGPHTFVPELTDGDVVEHPAGSGRRWRRVRYGEGAYLVRVEDNNDDHVENPALTLRTGNTPGSIGSAPFCVEGPDAALGAGGRDNPARDRDGAVWLTVVGVHPGDDPDRALHRTVLRKLVVDTTPAAGAAFEVGGDLDKQPGGDLRACNERGGVAVVGDIVGAGGGARCACGTVAAGGSIDPTLGDSCGCCGGNAYSAQPSSAVPAPVLPPAVDKSWYDWASVCNFYMDPAEGLFYWDARGERDGRACSAHAGQDLVAPSRDSFPGACWVPLWNRDGVAIFDELHTGAAREVDPPGAGAPGSARTWRPRGAAAGPFTTRGADPSGGDWYQAPATSGGFHWHKPDWSACPDTPDTDFAWDPEAVRADPSCDPVAGCDGAHDVVRFTPGAGPRSFELLHVTPFSAYPTGVYFHRGSLETGFGPPPPPVPPAQAPPSAWPMITLITDGDLTTTGKSLFLGVGTKKGAFASLVADGDVELHSANRSFLAAGSVWARGKLHVGHSTDVRLHGTLHLGGDLVIDNGADFSWEYDVDLESTSTAGPPPVMPRVAFPLRF